MRLSLWYRLVLLLATAAGLTSAVRPQTRGPIELGARDFSRGFDTREVRHRFSLASSKDLRYSSLAELTVNLSTTLGGRGLGRDPRAALIDGYVAMDLPPEVVAAGPLRLYFRDAQGIDHLLYSVGYPDLPRYRELAKVPARDAQPGAWLAYLDLAAKALDPRANVAASGETLRAIPTGQSAFWVIPADLSLHPLVEFFGAGPLPPTPELVAKLPVRVVNDPQQARVQVHVGALSCAAALVEVTPDLAPPGSLPLAEVAGGTGAAEADPAAKVPLLVYSCEWLVWDAEFPLLAGREDQPMLAPSHEPPTIDLDKEDLRVEVVQPTQPEGRPAESAPKPAEAKPQPKPVKPSASPPAKSVSPPAPSSAKTGSPGAPPATATTTARQVELGTLPVPVEEYEVELKPITGAAGQRQATEPAGSRNYDPGQPSQPGYAGSEPGVVRYYGPGGPDNLHDGGPPEPMPAPPGLGTMVLIPAGKFLMGTDAGTPYGDADELPQHEVNLPAFYIDRYPVTNRQFGQFIVSAGYSAEGEWARYSSPALLDMPVRCVSWNDANAYAQWAGKRLPSEAEWEKAARGTDGRLFPWGNDWNASILPRGEFGYELVTAQKAASPYGVMALAGVLWQWCSTPWHEYPFDPKARGEKMILRGGAFSNGRNIVRCANRYFEMPGVALNTFTFRCVKDVP